MTDHDFDEEFMNIKRAKTNLENAQAEYDKLLFANLIGPLDPLYHMEPFNSELMQLKERNDQMLIGELDKGGGKFQIELMQKLHDVLLEIPWEHENGEANPECYSHIAYRSSNCFLSSHHFSLFELLQLIGIAYKARDSYMASLRAIKRLENDPVQKALDEVYDEYERRKSHFKRRGYSAQFSREMHDKFPVITSIKTIERLVSELNKENEYIPR